MAWGDAQRVACPSPVDGHTSPDLSLYKEAAVQNAYAMTNAHGDPDGRASLCPPLYVLFPGKCQGRL